jgi:hypothetical protein
MPRLIAFLLPLVLSACGSLPELADPASDAPETIGLRTSAFKDVNSYSEALRVWQSPEDVNAWIAARFTYDMSRATRLSETQRSRASSIAIYLPQELFGAPSGVCVDLSRFAVETLRQIDPDATSRYLMIEFAPVEIAGNTLRFHWLASFTREGDHYFFADSKRPGHIAGPYASVEDFVGEYALYRGRQIVSFRELDSYQRKQRALALKQTPAR